MAMCVRSAVVAVVTVSVLIMLGCQSKEGRPDEVTPSDGSIFPGTAAPRTAATPDVNLLLEPGATLVDFHQLQGPLGAQFFLVITERSRTGEDSWIACAKPQFDIIVGHAGASQWKRIATWTTEGCVGEVLRGDLTGDGSEDVIIQARIPGSTSELDYWVYGYVEDEVKLLLDRHGLFGATVEVTPSGLLEREGNKTILFTWDGQQFIGSRVTSPQQPAGSEVSVVHYRIDNGQVFGPRQVSLHVGQSLQLVRDDLSETVERILYSDNGVIEHRGKDTWTALKVGSTDITIIPDGYNWEQSLTITVSVSP